MIKVHADYKGLKSETFIHREDFFIGRLAGEFRPEVALNLDLRVAGKHARVRRRGARWWLEDLGTQGGTFVNGERLTGSHPLTPGDVVRVGSTKLTFMDSSPVEEPAPEPTTSPATPASVAPDDFSVSSTMDARETAPFYFDLAQEDAQARLAQLLALPLALTDQVELARLCQRALDRAMDLLPGAERGALLAYDPATNKLALRAARPAEDPPVSRALIQKAVADGQGFIWNQGDAFLDPTMSMKRLVIASGMYVPLLWRGEVMCVLCVDNPHHAQAFQDEDLRYLMVASQYIAAALAGHHKITGTPR